MNRVHCPRHGEKTPSCVIYETHAFCYGGCGKIELKELGNIDVKPYQKKPPEDISARLAYIRDLATAPFRGLTLPVDGEFSYIVWPGQDYFKARRLFPGGKPKYTCPRGIPKPLYIPHDPKEAHSLFVVEGELNALSIASLNPKSAVCSPGGVGDFKAGLLHKYREFFKRFGRFYIVADKDKPGLEAALELQDLLVWHSPYVYVALMERDCNDLLQESNEALKQQIAAWEADMRL